MRPLLPGSTLGVLGSGQLGRMLALSAREMGYRVHTLSSSPDSPAGQVADREVVAPYDDVQAVGRFAQDVDVVTFEFENVASASARAARESAPVRPAGEVLHTTQNRLREKRFLESAGIPVAPFREVRSPGDLERALAELGTPAVLKTAGWGYDGKGQVKMEEPAAAAAAWAELGRRAPGAAGGSEPEAVLEAFVDFRLEASVVLARALDGAVADFGVMENRHRRHILDATLSPAGIPEEAARAARALAAKIADAFDYVGVLCVELFVTAAGELLVNELAPRPHNSGHLTLEAFDTSQFEQQLRAVCGLPLGSTARRAPAAAMVNLLGDLWFPAGSEEPRAPAWDAALAVPGAHLHLYGKTEPRPGRKMGHLTVLGETADGALELAERARAALTSDR